MICNQCHAVIQSPVDLAATTMTCGYCGATQVVPDLVARQRAIHEARLADVEAQREARLAVKQQHDIEQARLAAIEKKRERKAVRWGVRIGWITSFLGVLVVPVIVGVFLFDLPARLGFGDAGEDQLKALITPFEAKGCTVVQPVSSTYRSAAFSKVVTVDAPCIRVLAASGPGHSSLKLELQSPEGKELGKAVKGSAPQLFYCTDNIGTVQFEVGVSAASKGRLSTAVLACPSDSPAKKRATPNDPESKDPMIPTPVKKSKR